jgi:uncharacterized protein (TIGR02145 family)
MKQFLILLMMTGILSVSSSAQVSINTDGSQPPSSAMLEVKSTTKGLLIPRMTTSQIAAIPTPADGLQVYNTEWGKLYVYVAASALWKEMSYGTGTILPANLNFICGDLLNDLRDGGKVYQTVQIGTQCWMKQNLNVGTRIDGSQEQQNNSVIEKYCYNNDESNCDVYGGLYQWNEMMSYAPSSNTNPSGVQGICPTGWHLPSDAERCQLETFVDPTVNCNIPYGYSGIDAGGKLKEAGTSHWTYPNTGANNSSGFSALPGGMRHTINDGAFYDVGLNSFIWTSTEYSTFYPRMHHYVYSSEQSFQDYNYYLYGYSVRCLKN